MSVSSVLLFGIHSGILPFFLLLCIVQILALLLCLRSVFWPEFDSGLDRFSKWYLWHLIGGVFVSLPTVVILLYIDEAFKSIGGIYYFTSLFFIGIIHFCNFTQLNCWMKSTIATIAGMFVLVIISNYFKSVNNSMSSHSSNVSQINVPLALLMNFSGLSSETNFSESPFDRVNVVTDLSDIDPNFNLFETNVNSHLFKNKSTNYHNFQDPFLSRSSNKSINYDYSTFNYEIYLDILLILLLVWFLNREFEISYRLSFHGNMVAARDKAKMQMMKDQAEVLLHNIIPRHVAEQLKITAR